MQSSGAHYPGHIVHFVQFVIECHAHQINHADCPKLIVQIIPSRSCSSSWADNPRQDRSGIEILRESQTIYCNPIFLCKCSPRPPEPLLSGLSALWTLPGIQTLVGNTDIYVVKDRHWVGNTDIAMSVNPTCNVCFPDIAMSVFPTQCLSFTT